MPRKQTYFNGLTRIGYMNRLERDDIKNALEKILIEIEELSEGQKREINRLINTLNVSVDLYIQRDDKDKMKMYIDQYIKDDEENEIAQNNNNIFISNDSRRENIAILDYIPTEKKKDILSALETLSCGGHLSRNERDFIKLLIETLIKEKEKYSKIPNNKMKRIGKLLDLLRLPTNNYITLESKIQIWSIVEEFCIELYSGNDSNNSFNIQNENNFNNLAIDNNNNSIIDSNMKNKESKYLELLNIERIKDYVKNEKKSEIILNNKSTSFDYLNCDGSNISFQEWLRRRGAHLYADYLEKETHQFDNNRNK